MCFPTLWWWINVSSAESTGGRAAGSQGSLADVASISKNAIPSVIVSSEASEAHQSGCCAPACDGGTIEAPGFSEFIPGKITRVTSRLPLIPIFIFWQVLSSPDLSKAKEGGKKSRRGANCREGLWREIRSFFPSCLVEDYIWPCGSSVIVYCPTWPAPLLWGFLPDFKSRSSEEYV